MKMGYRDLGVLLVSLLVAGRAQGASVQPELVSPGATKATVEVADRCPTFNWSSNETATNFELVVYGFSPETMALGVVAEEVAPVLRVKIPGAARGWTPSLDRCLDAGKSYAWTLRAAAEGKPSQWAEPRMFTVRAAPSTAEVEAALSVLNLFLEDVQKGEVEPIKLEVASEGRESQVKTTGPETSADEAASDPMAPEGTGIAAIRGEVPDPTGETYGVEGISNSADGAGLSAENTADATDLRLQGDGMEPDAELTESTLDRPSDSAQSFDIRNSGVGVMTLQVDGTDVVTTLTDADTLASLGCNPTEIAKWNGSDWVCAADENNDTLGGLSCADNQVPQWDGAAWVCANTGTDTLASLSCGPGQVVHWNGSVWICGQPTLIYATCSASNSCSAACPASSIVWTGGCTATPASATLIKSTPTNAGMGQPPTGWSCSAFNPLGGATVTVDLYCVSQ